MSLFLLPQWLCVCFVTESCLTLQPHVLQPARLLYSWDFPGKNVGGVVISSSRRDPQPRDQTHISWVSCIDKHVNSLPLSHLGKPFPRKASSKISTAHKHICLMWNSEGKGFLCAGWHRQKQRKHMQTDINLKFKLTSGFHLPACLSQWIIKLWGRKGIGICTHLKNFHQDKLMTQPPRRYLQQKLWPVCQRNCCHWLNSWGSKYIVIIIVLSTRVLRKRPGGSWFLETECQRGFYLIPFLQIIHRYSKVKFIGIFSHTDAELALSSLDQQDTGKQAWEVNWCSVSWCSKNAVTVTMWASLG